MKPALVILAAGMGSRYGKLKQMDAFGPNDETIIDYSLYDAIKAGFGKVIFIIRDYFRGDFEDFFRKRLEGHVEVEFVSQEIHNVPEGTEYHSDRTKPWGTAHAIWVAKSVIDRPFGVINADDYYGTEAFQQLYSFLTTKTDKDDFSLVGYHLPNTLSEHGSVNRGVCNVDSEGYLIDINECTKIQRDDDGIIRFPNKEGFEVLDENTIVSMNMWGFLPSLFDYFDSSLKSFLENHGKKLTSEFYIPALVDEMIKNEIVGVKVLETTSDWFGVTYQEDKPYVMNRLNALISQGVYPHKLWK